MKNSKEKRIQSVLPKLFDVNNLNYFNNFEVNEIFYTRSIVSKIRRKLIFVLGTNFPWKKFLVKLY